MKLPDNNPSAYIRRKKFDSKKKRVVLIGDSLTMGRDSAYYVKILAHRLNSNQYELINAGINSELAWNVSQQLETIIACRPHIVTLLIGSNDVNCILSPNKNKSYIKKMKLPHAPNQDFYRNSLMEIIKLLSRETEVRIGALSLPTFGERMDSREFIIGTQYSRIVEDVAKETGISYLPLHKVSNLIEKFILTDKPEAIQS